MRLTIDRLAEAPEIEVVTRLDSIADEWDALATEVRSSPFVRPDWIERAWTTHKLPGRLQVVTARDGDGLSAVLPMQATPHRVRTHSNYFAWVGEGLVARDEVAAREVVAGLLERRPRAALFASVDFRPELSSAILDASASGDRTVIARRRARGPVIRLRGRTYADYERSLPGRFRNELTRTARRLAERGSLELQLTRDWDPDLYADGLRLESSGWKGQRGSTILADQSSTIFYERIARWAAERGKLVLSALALDGRRIAFSLGVVDNGVFYGLKSGMDPEFSTFGPGKLLIQRMLVWAEGQNLDLELMGAAERYKLGFSTETRELLLCETFAGTVSGSLVRASVRAKRRLGQGAASAAKRVDRRVAADA